MSILPAKMGGKGSAVVGVAAVVVGVVAITSLLHFVGQVIFLGVVVVVIGGVFRLLRGGNRRRRYR